MQGNTLKDKVTTLFNGRAGMAISSSLKGGSTSIQLLSLAAKAGIVATVAPLPVAAVAVACTLLAGGIVARDKFKTAVQKAAEKKKQKAVPGLNPSPQFVLCFAM